jgi:hypothetical protein
MFLQTILSGQKATLDQQLVAQREQHQAELTRVAALHRHELDTAFQTRNSVDGVQDLMQRVSTLYRPLLSLSSSSVACS